MLRYKLMSLVSKKGAALKVFLIYVRDEDFYQLLPPDTPIILGGVFATMNAKNILADCPYVDSIGVGEGEELLPDWIT